MMKAVFDQAGLEYELVACQMKADGSRPTTLDTIQAWLAQKPQPGFIIAISNQPYVIYQDAVLRSQLPADFTLETVGHSAGGTTPELVLDTIARTLYIELMHAKEMR